MNPLGHLWRLLAESPSRGVALAKLLVAFAGLLILGVLAVLGYGHALPAQFGWLVTLVGG